MKSKILISLLLIIISYASNAQFVKQSVGGSSGVESFVRGAFSADSGLIVKSFPDTLTANRGANIKKANGLIIKVNDTLFLRDAGRSIWLKFATQQYNNLYIDSSISNIYNYINNNLYGSDSTSRNIDVQVINDSLFIFHTTLGTYKINGITYTAQANTNITTSGNCISNGRYLIFYGDTLGNIGYTESLCSDPNPGIPPIDPYSQVLIKTYFIEAGATTPIDATHYDIYLDNNEWLTSSSTITGFNADYTTAPFAGSKSIFIPQVISGKKFQLYDSGFNHVITNTGILTFQLKLLSTFASSTKIAVSLYKDDNLVSAAPVIISSNQYGYSRTVVGSYKPIAIPFSKFPLINGNYNKVVFTFQGATNASGMQIDNIIIANGGGNTGGTTGLVSINNNVGPNAYIYITDTSYALNDSVTRFSKSNGINSITWDVLTRGSKDTINSIWPFILNDSSNGRKYGYIAPTFINDTILRAFNNLDSIAPGHKRLLRVDGTFEDLYVTGGSGCPVTFFTSPDSLYYVRDSCGVLDSTQWVGGGTGSSGGSISDVLQTYTAGASVTVTNGTNILLVNPATLQSTLTITLPATPSARNDIEIYFGGTIAAGSNVITTVTITANTGQTLYESLVPTTMGSGEYLSYKWIPSLNRWYAKR